MLFMFLHLILFFIGLAILIYGADILVRGSASLSKKLGIPAIVIGLTVVAFGTSAPELVVNLVSAFNHNTDIAVGNIVGSNIVNILLILGISALITNLKVERNTTWKEIPFALLAICAVFFLTNDILFDKGVTNILSRIDGIVLLLFFTVFMAYIIGLAKQNTNESGQEIVVYKNITSVFYVVAGLGMLFLGGKMLVNEAVLFAQMAGMSEMLIGLTVVAIGTSLPELATSIIAARKGQADIAIGNIVGSNIFNIFWILGLTGTITPITVSAVAQFDILVCILVTLILFVSMFIGRKQQLGKFEGLLFLLLYITYTIAIVLRG